MALVMMILEASKAKSQSTGDRKIGGDVRRLQNLRFLQAEGSGFGVQEMIFT